MENIAAPITKEEASAELDRATAAALTEYHRVRASLAKLNRALAD
jgi:hypothetical protein